jgi:polysaccharide pyruvyl transferase WcaK-like protein
VSRPHFCLTGGWFSSDNIGDHAILSGLVDALRGRFDDPLISVITADPEKVERLYALPSFAPRKTPIALLRNLSSADALLFTGGTPFYDDSMHMGYYWTLAKWARLRGVPVAVFGISLRTFTKAFTRNRLTGIAGSAVILGGREQRTIDRFQDLVGADDPRPVFVPDAATQMRPADEQEARRLIERTGADPDRPTIAICMRDFTAGEDFQTHHYSRSYTPDQLNRYVEAVRALVRSAVVDHDHDVLLCPMHTNPPDDDRRIHRVVTEGIEDAAIRDRTFSVDEQHGPRQMKAVLGTMRACVGVRFHSLVLATSMGVPTMTVAYAHKNHSIMDQMGLGDYTIDLADVDSRTTVAMLGDLMNHRVSIGRSLLERNDEIHARYDAALQELADALA